MDKATYHRLMEGEALHFEVSLDSFATLGECLKCVRTNNELFHLITYKWALSFLEHEAPGLCVLDAASGSGYGSNMLARHPHVARVIGVDLNDDHIAFSRRHYPDLEFYLGDISGGLEFIDSQSVDLVTSFQTIEHVVDPVSFLHTFWRVLKPTGYLLLATPTHDDALQVLPARNPYHLVEYNPATMSELTDFFLKEYIFFTHYPTGMC